MPVNNSSAVNFLLTTQRLMLMNALRPQILKFWGIQKLKALSGSLGGKTGNFGEIPFEGLHQKTRKPAGLTTSGFLVLFVVVFTNNENPAPLNVTG
ncbi:hypothetical protein [Thermosporothrix hazakensis]|uniref:hypothetical protein n=1 Tax=Thermosporothrix hazakensis TaxID=644383 RepID=UPI000DAB5FCC|nr:hypothetical protein [Thermosporothrix hazakensis]